MQDAVPFVWTSAILYRIFFSLLVAGAGALIMWPIRKARTEWLSLRESIAETKNELEHQRTNCLATLQIQGQDQVNLLGKVCTTLDGVRLDLKEQTGFIQAMALRPLQSARARRSPRAKK
jgi:hypothetical protein